MAKVVAVNDVSFKHKVLQDPKTTAVFFTETGSVICHAMMPNIENIAEGFGDKINIFTVNLQESPKTFAEYGVKKVPHLIIFRDCKFVVSIAGAQPAREIITIIRNVLEPSPPLKSQS